MRKFTYLITFFLLISCQDHEIIEPLISISTNPTISYISEIDTSTSVSVADAKTFANSFMRANSSRNHLSEPTVEIVKEGSDTLMYILNYPDNGGYIIISSNKQKLPIIAHSNTGNFHFDNIANELKNGIYSYLKNMASDTTNNILASTMWSKFLKKTKPKSTSKSRMIYIDDDEEMAIREQIDQWIMDGYDVYTVADYIDGLPFSPYVPASISNAAQTIYNSEYDQISMSHPKDTSYVLIRTYSISSNSFYLLNTLWGQGYPYNTAIPYYITYDGESIQGLLGCTTVALGQILRYHADISGYDFGSMPNQTTEPHEGLSKFLYDVGCKIGIDYSTVETSNQVATIPQVESALDAYNYYHKQSTYTYSSFKTELNNLRPIMMFGLTNSSTIGHAWVCDGLYEHEYITEYKVMVLDYQPGDLLRGPFIENASSTNTATYRALHHNWGEYGDENGYLGAGYFCYNKNDYSNNIKALINLKHK